MLVVNQCEHHVGPKHRLTELVQMSLTLEIATLSYSALDFRSVVNQTYAQEPKLPLACREAMFSRIMPSFLVHPHQCMGGHGFDRKIMYH